jgi:sodium-dependent dicarboxylate transporter 2/3/5
MNPGGKKWIKIIVLLFASFAVGSIISNNESQRIGMTILVLIGGLWITELIPLTISALLVPILAYFSHIFDAREALSHFSNPVIYVFVGGFTLAAVLNQHGIDKWLAGKMVIIAKGNSWKIIILFLILTSFLSMWMSNTATTAMLLPISMSLIDKKYPRARTYIILGTAYASSIGGIATLVGSPPNLIAAAALNIDFATWIKFGLPFTILFFPVLMITLKFIIRPEKGFQLNHVSVDEIEWSPQKSRVVIFFIAVVSLWIMSKPISDLLRIENFDSIVALGATVAAPLFGLISWGELERKINWGILLLFGGGLCLSAILSETGTSAMLAKGILLNINTSQGLLLILATIVFMVYLTEISSNTGAAAILVPIMMEVATQFNPLYVLPMVLAIGISANCAFMLPVATPPNALAYSTNEVSMKQMMRTGFFLNLLAIPVIWIVVSLRLLNLL